MARIMITLVDLKPEKAEELIQAIEAETGEWYGAVEASHEIYIQVDISEDDVSFS